MALTKNDIEQAVSTSEHQAQIRHSLSNYFEDLEKPVAVAISLNASKSMNVALKHNDIADLANNLRKKGIDAVSYLDKEAARPDKYIITPDGIQTPVLKAEDALKAAIIIEDQVCSQDNIRLSGHANLLNNGNLVYSAANKSKTEGRVLDIKSSHPHPENIAKILEKYGEDYDTFIDRKVSEAVAQAIDIDVMKMDEHNMMNGREYVWRGATFVGKPFAVTAPRNARRVAYASPELIVSNGYTGYGSTSSGTGGASFPKTKSGKNYGCLYQFKTLGDEQIYYGDTGLEAAVGGVKYKKEEHGLPFETGVLEHKNEVLAMYLHVGPNKYFPIPINKHGNITDPEWKDFAALHEPSDDSVYGYMAQRLDAQKRELDANPEHCYNLELKELAPTEIENRKFNAEEFATALAYRGNIEKDESGQVIINQDVYCDLDVKNVDFSQMTIKGTCSFNDVGTISVFDLPQIKETETGLTTKLEFKGSGHLTDVDKITTNDLLKITGTWQKGSDYSEMSLSINSDLHVDSLPKDFNDHHYNRVSINGYVNKIEDFPQTQMGCDYLKVRDQSSIENMTVDDFQSKIKGNFGKTIEHSLNLSTTNITVLPKDMKYETVDSVTLNPKAIVTSLDNYPKTQDGTHGINFEGDLSNLTTEEFLLKVKGETWCKENLATNEDGSKRCKNFQLDDKGTFKITKYPKDIGNYEFINIIKPEIPKEWNQEAKKQRTLAKINDKEIVLTASEALSIGDLSDFKCETIQIKGNKQDISALKLPEQAKNIIVSDVSKLPELPKNCEDLSILNSNIEESKLNLMHCKNISIKNCNLEKTSITFPEKANLVILENCQFSNNQVIDLSRCRRGNLSEISGGTAIKMPQESTSWYTEKIPDNAVEISTKFINSSKVKIPADIKIIDSIDDNGKKIPLKHLKDRLSKKQINALRKERLLAPVKKFMAKFIPASKQDSGEPKKAISIKKKIPQQKVDIKNADKKHLAALSGRTATPKKHETIKQGDAQIRPNAELKFEMPMQTSDFPPAPKVVQAPSQSEYEKFASQNADSKLRKICEDLHSSPQNEELYKKIVTEWNKQYYENPPQNMEQGDNIAKNVMMKYQRDIEPFAAEHIQQEIKPLNSEKADNVTLNQLQEDIQHKDPSARAEVVAEWNKKVEDQSQEQKAAAQFSGQKISDLSGQEKGVALTKMRVEADNPFSGEGYTAAKAAMAPKTEVRTQTLQNAGAVPQMAFNAAQKDGGIGSR